MPRSALHSGQLMVVPVPTAYVYARSTNLKDGFIHALNGELSIHAGLILYLFLAMISSVMASRSRPRSFGTDNL